MKMRPATLYVTCQHRVTVCREKAPAALSVHQSRGLEYHPLAGFFRYPEPGVWIRQFFLRESVDSARRAPHVDLFQYVLTRWNIRGDLRLHQHTVFRAAIPGLSPDHRRQILDQDYVVLRVSLVNETGESVVEVRTVVHEVQLHSHHVTWHILARLALVVQLLLLIDVPGSPR